jgi:hypothetical protein
LYEFVCIIVFSPITWLWSNSISSKTSSLIIRAFNTFPRFNHRNNSKGISYRTQLAFSRWWKRFSRYAFSQVYIQIKLHFIFLLCILEFFSILFIRWNIIINCISFKVQSIVLSRSSSKLKTTNIIRSILWKKCCLSLNNRWIQSFLRWLLITFFYFNRKFTILIWTHDSSKHISHSQICIWYYTSTPLLKTITLCCCKFFIYASILHFCWTSTL